MPEENKVSSALQDREIANMRVLNSPRELVFKAYTDPKHLVNWWGPKAFTNTFQEFELKPGSVWRFIMHGPDGTDYQNKMVYEEIVKPERIVMQHVSSPQFQVTVTLDDLGGKTRVTFRMLFDTAEECAKVKVLAAEANEQNFERLEVELAKMS
jgi:uncharacterized protein YndB with AHSA1/START domain